MHAQGIRRGTPVASDRLPSILLEFIPAPLMHDATQASMYTNLTGRYYFDIRKKQGQLYPRIRPDEHNYWHAFSFTVDAGSEQPSRVGTFIRPNMGYSKKPKWTLVSTEPIADQTADAQIGDVQPVSASNVASVAAAETAASSKMQDAGADGAVSESLHAFDVREPTIAAARASPSDAEAATSIDPIPV